MKILVGEIKEGFRGVDVENVSAELVGFPLPEVTDSALGPSPSWRKLAFC